jgi:hypothetical protein
MSSRRQIAFINVSSLITDADMSLIARACAVQLCTHLEDAWRGPLWDVVAYKDPLLVPDSAIPHYFIDSADVANAAGYHSVDPVGRSYIRTFIKPSLDNGHTLLRGAGSVSVTASHECLEAAVDEFAADFVIFPNGITLPSGKTSSGLLLAKEVCDPCEATTYEIDLSDSGSVTVSDFVLPEYFNVRTAGSQLTYCDSIAKPFGMAAGGYQILLGPDGFSQEFENRADYPEYRLSAREKDLTSRAARRMRKLGTLI